MLFLSPVSASISLTSIRFSKSWKKTTQQLQNVEAVDTCVVTYHTSVFNEGRGQPLPRQAVHGRVKEHGAGIGQREHLHERCVRSTSALARGKERETALCGWEAPFEYGGDKACVAVDVVPNGEDWDPPVCDPEEVRERGARGPQGYLHRCIARVRNASVRVWNESTSTRLCGICLRSNTFLIRVAYGEPS